MNKLRTAEINSTLEARLTRARLAKYLVANDNNLDAALTSYEANTHLSEAFYTPLQGLEICFRNTIHREMSNEFGNGWTTNGYAHLSEASQAMVQEAVNELNKTHHWPSDDDIVAELRFAFWVSLLGPGYDSTIWRKPLHKGFRADGPKKRSVVHRRLNAIRRFRNRVAHHEPILYRKPEEIHNEILEAIGWMCPQTKAWVEHHSRVPTVLRTISSA